MADRDRRSQPGSRLTGGGVDLGAVLDLALDLAGRAGALLLDGRRHRGAGAGTKTSGTDVVTDADRASESLIVEGILAARPDDGILAEEGSARPGTSGVRWVIDPLDGTTNYLYGLPAWVVSIGVEVDGATQVGVVADPSHGETYSALRGAGSWCNGQRLAVSGATDLAVSLIATGFAYRPSRRMEQAAALPLVLGATRDIRRAGAAALDLCWVASARLDGYYETGLKPWDVAAGLLIATEAGAATCGFDGGPASGASVVAATPGIAGQLVDLLAAAGATPDPG